MTVRSILIVPDARLNKISQPVSKIDDSIRSLMKDMVETMYAANGIGLAAVQIGVLLRVIVIDLVNDQKQNDVHYFINPEIYETSGEMNDYNEGCLSIPQQYANIRRPAWCRVRFLDFHGNPQDILCEGMLATCIQHEVDHLNGVLFINYLSQLKKNMIIRKVVKSTRQDKLNQYKG